MDLEAFGGLQRVLLLAIACGTGVGVLTYFLFLLSVRNARRPARTDPSEPAPRAETAMVPPAPKPSRLLPDDRARAAAFIKDLSVPANRDNA